MRRFILSENGLELIKGKILRESYSDKIDLVKRFLDKNFMRASTQKDGKDVGIFVKLNGNIPTDESLWKQDVLDILDDEFNNIISDKKERDGFLKRVIKDWYTHKISKNGSLSKYDF